MALRSERRYINKHDIKSGMLVEFSYKKEGGTARGIMSSYQALVIDPKISRTRKQDNTSNIYFHALLIDKLTDKQIITLVTTIGRDFDFGRWWDNIISGSDVEIQKNRRLPLTELASTEVYNNYKGSWSGIAEYRTFLFNNIINMRQILIGSIV